MKIKLLVEGGNMKPGPAVAQQLGPIGVNLGKVISDVNSVTAGFKGMNVPVELDVNPKTKNYEIEVFSPSVAELIKKELKLEKGSGESGKTWVGNLAIEQAIRITKTKMNNLLAKNLKAGVKLVVGTCVSLGVFVESKNPKNVIEEINSGIYDKEINSEKSEVSDEKRKKLEKEFAEVAAEQAKKKKAEEEAKAAAEAAKAGAVPAEGAATVPEGGEKKAMSEEKKPEEKKEEKKKK